MESEERPRARPSSRQRESFQDKEKVVKKLLKDDRLNTITPSSGLDLLIRQVLAPRNSGTILYHFDEEGNPIRPPASPLRRSMQPLDNIVDRMRLKQKSWYDGNEMEAETDEPSRLLNLPTELQFYIISYLGLSDLERLRRTCQYYRFLLSANYVRALFGGHAGLVSQLTGHCLSCISTPGRNSLILQHTTPQDRNSENRARKPAISSKCFSCAVHDRELEVGKTVPLANMGKAWVCRWCGWPVAGPHSWANEQFHVGCYDRYYRVLWVFLSLGFAQFGAGIGAAVLSVVYFRDELVVFAPTVINFVLLWLCIVLLMLRGNRIRTYHWVGMVELIIMALWIPPIYAVASNLERHPDGKVFTSSIAVLSFFALNTLFRLLNFLGNIVLALEYDMTKHYVPQIALRRRLFNLLMVGLIYWTYPQCVEQKYPPHFN